MKIGLAANMFREGYDRFGNQRYKKLREHGFDGIDFGMANTKTVFYDGDESELRRMMNEEKALAENEGIEIFQIHGPWRYPPMDFEEADRRERMDKMCKSIRAASYLGCRNWVVHPIMPLGTSDTEEGTEEQTYELNLKFMRELLAYAKDFGVTVCLENMPFRKFSLSKPADILKFVREINDESFKICLDTGHVSVFEGLKAGDEVRKLGGEIRAFHMHDNNGNSDEHKFPKSGIIDWKDFAAAVREIKYDGAVCIESLPDARLEDKEFEEQCIELHEIADEILNG